MPSDLSFRHAQLRDVDAVTDLINRAFRIERFFVDHDRIAAPGVRERLSTGVFILAEAGETVLGCVYVELHGKRCYLGLLSVDPTRQRSGIGAQLMAAAEDYARERGCEAMDLLIVNLREEMRRYYGRLGYVETGTAPFPEGVPTKLPCHFIQMTKNL